jgi:hypothetical protein
VLPPGRHPSVVELVSEMSLARAQLLAAPLTAAMHASFSPEGHCCLAFRNHRDFGFRFFLASGEQGAAAFP